MPLRSIFEGLGNFMEWSFQILPFLNDNANYVFILTIAGAIGYWIAQMFKHQRAGEK